MRICLVSSYPPNRARLSEYAKSLVKELARRPKVDKIYVLADVADGAKNHVEEGFKVEVLRIWKADSPLSILSIVTQTLKLKPDVVHFNVHFQSFGRSRLSNFIGLSLIFICRVLGLKVLASVHNFGELVDLVKVKVKPTMLNRVGILFATKLVLSASMVVVTVNSYMTYLRKRFRHVRTLYIPHGAHVNDCPLINNHGKVLLVFGHMGPYKGLPVMLRAFEELVKGRDDVKLVVAGSSHPNFPGYIENFAKAANPKVDFLGYVRDEDLARVFDMANVVVLPYTTATGTSGVFHLACGYGKPVVASDLPEIREMLAEGASALLVPPGDVESLKNAIRAILDDETFAAEMGRRNLMFAQKESWSVVAKSYEEAYLRVLNG
jgi:glycosyltransferase involved in cell wall biosynthesis